MEPNHRHACEEAPYHNDTWWYMTLGDLGLLRFGEIELTARYFGKKVEAVAAAAAGAGDECWWEPKFQWRFYLIVGVCAHGDGTFRQVNW